MKYLFVFSFFCVFKLIAMQPADLVLLTHFKTMKTRDIEDPACRNFLKWP